MADVPSWDTEVKRPSWETEVKRPSWETEAQPEVSVLKDMGKSAVSGLGTGVLSIPGMPGDLQSLAAHYDPTGWLKEKTEQGYRLPTTKEFQSKVEKYTGPFYEPQTWQGRVTHGAASAAPAALAGGEGAVIAALRAVGAGGGGEIGNQVAKVAPESWQPWIRAGGSLAGFMGGPRMVTPNPMTAEQLAATSALSPAMKQASTAGQWTDSPFWRTMEAYSGKGAKAPAAQEEVFTREAAARAGHEGPLSELQDTLDYLKAGRENIRRSNEINPTELAALQRQNASRTYNLQGTATNAAQAGPYADLVKDMLYGPHRNAYPNGIPPASVIPKTIPGQRYENIRNTIEGQEAKGNLRDAFGNMKTDLDKAWENSLGPAKAKEYADSGQQMQAGITLKDSLPTNKNASTIRPEDLRPTAAKQGDTKSVQFADNAARVMTELPEKAKSAPAWFNLLNTAGASLGGAAVGHAAGGLTGALAGFVGAPMAERAVVGHLLADAIWRTGAGVAGKAAAFKPVQAVAKNQIARPPDTNFMNPKVLAAVNALRLTDQPYSGPNLGPLQPR